MSHRDCQLYRGQTWLVFQAQRTYPATSLYISPSNCKRFEEWVDVKMQIIDYKTPSRYVRYFKTSPIPDMSGMPKLLLCKYV